MPIPKSQLETWAKQGAIATAKKTHESIRYALADMNLPLAKGRFEIYLQGSYKNDTNIFGDSDIDVVVQLNSTFMDDTSSISETERSLYESSFQSASSESILWSG
jgi:tRNA nucleotidyltransferase (CCA-adding enzyme)